MTIASIINNIDQFWSQSKPSDVMQSLYSAISDRNADSVVSTLSYNSIEATDDDNLNGERQALVYKAILTADDNRDILDALLAQPGIKRAIKEAAFDGLVDTLYSMSYGSDIESPKVNKLSALIENFGSSLKFSKNANEDGVKLDASFVVAGLLRFAILSGVSAENIQKVFDNPTFTIEDCGLTPGYINYLKEIYVIARDQIDLKARTVIEECRPGQESIIDKIHAVEKKLFNFDTVVDFEESRFNLTDVEIVIDDADQGFASDDSQDPNKFSSESTTKNKTEETPPTPPAPSKKVADYINICKTIDTSNLDFSATNAWNNILAREYNRDLFSSGLEDGIKGLAETNKDFADAMLIGSSVLMTLNFTDKKKSGEWMYNDAYINNAKKVPQKCVAGKLEHNNKELDVMVEIKYNSAPKAVFTKLTSPSDPRAAKCEAFKNDLQPNDLPAHATNNFFSFSYSWAKALHPEQLETQLAGEY